MMFIRKLTGMVLYPWLLALYPVIYLYSVNQADIREDDVLEVVFVVLAATTIMYIVAHLLLRDIHKAGAVTGVIALLFLTYGHIYNALESSDLGQQLLMPVMVVLSFVAILLILRSKSLWQQLTPYLNMIFVVLVIMPSLQVVSFWIDRPPLGATARINPLEQVLSTQTVTNSIEYPDVYYIILDGYSSNEFWLREYGYDNSNFTDALEERGFYVAYESLSNYPATLLSLPSALNMRYMANTDFEIPKSEDIHRFAYMRSLIANSQVAYEFKQQGYIYINILSGFLSPSVMADTNVVFFPDGPRYFEGNEFAAGDTGFNVSWTYKQPFWPFFIETTLLRSESSRFSSQQEDEPYPVYAPEIFHGTFDELQKIAEMEEATFTFAHITKPHSPLQFDRQGNVISVELSNDEPLKQEYFFDQLDYLNERMLQLIDHILAESTVPPIIIIQGDHSSDLGENVNSTCLYTFEILNAYHLPGDGAENLYPAIQPVNSFRVIFNHYFGQDYELLEHGHYTQPRACEHNDPTLVQVMDDERLNVEFGDHIALLYNAPGDNGTPQFQIHALNSDGEKGELLFTVSYKDVEEYLDSPPNQNTPIINRDGVVLYALTSGEFQFNIGPDAEGREWAIIIDILSSQVISGYEVGTDG